MKTITKIRRLWAKIKFRWQAETPKIARTLQYTSGIIAACIGALAVFWTSIPESWTSEIPKFLTNHLVYVGFLATGMPFILQLFKKDKS